MNERICELAQRAGLIAKSNDDLDFKTALTPNEIKFAELIVRECARVGLNTAYPDGGVAALDAIKKHFGIET